MGGSQRRGWESVADARPTFILKQLEGNNPIIVTQAAVVSGPACPHNHPSPLPLSPPPGCLIDRNTDT